MVNFKSLNATTKIVSVDFENLILLFNPNHFFCSLEFRQVFVNFLLFKKIKESKSLSMPGLLHQDQPSDSLKPIDIVFVKHVRVGGAAYLGGLREGDRLISINNISLNDKSYSDIILIIENRLDTKFYTVFFFVHQRYYLYLVNSNRLTANACLKAHVFIMHVHRLYMEYMQQKKHVPISKHFR